MEEIDQFLLFTDKKICKCNHLSEREVNIKRWLDRYSIQRLSTTYSMLSQDKDRTRRVVRRLRSDFTHFLLLSSR